MNEIKPHQHAPSFRVIPFPMASRVGKVRRCAEVIARMSKPEAEGYWRNLVKRLCVQMENAGVERSEARRQLLNFQAAVKAELGKRARSGPPPRNHGPKGAA